MLNKLIGELAQLNPPTKYHIHEYCLAEYVIGYCHWTIYKVGNRWKGLDYVSILESAGFYDVGESNLMLAAAGRTKAAINRNQNNFDDMERSHQRILATVLSIILYHRTNFKKA